VSWWWLLLAWPVLSALAAPVVCRLLHDAEAAETRDRARS
jgi:hypothetical protein